MAVGYGLGEWEAADAAAPPGYFQDASTAPAPSVRYQALRGATVEMFEAAEEMCEPLVLSVPMQNQSPIFTCCPYSAKIISALKNLSTTACVQCVILPDSLLAKLKWNSMVLILCSMMSEARRRLSVRLSI